MSSPSHDRGRLSTETAHPASSALDRLSIQEAVALFARADREALEAVVRAHESIERAVELVASRLRSGGRLLYVGAGTSGRLAALDAAECPPTFRSDPEQVQAILAGGNAALLGAVEGAEDDEAAAARAIAERNVGRRDVVLGITAGGTTPFVHAALASARARGAATIFLACVGAEEVAALADLEIRLLTGPEVLADSTRLKAGTATKLALNTLSTLVMVRLGKVYGNRMVDLDARANAKLVDRAERMVMELARVDRDRARELMERANGRVKVAILMARAAIGAEEAERRLARAEGFLDRALEQDAGSSTSRDG